MLYCVEYGSLTIVINKIMVSTKPNKSLNSIELSLSTRIEDRRLPIVVYLARIAAILHQILNQLYLALPRCVE